jgi:hypothetical protein
MGEWVNRSTFSWPRHHLEMSSQVYAPAALPPKKEPPVPIGWEVGWAPEPVWTTWRREDSWSYLDSNSNPSLVQRVASRFTDCAIPAPWAIFHSYQNSFSDVDLDDFRITKHLYERFVRADDRAPLVSATTYVSHVYASLAARISAFSIRTFLLLSDFFSPEAYISNPLSAIKLLLFLITTNSDFKVVRSPSMWNSVIILGITHLSPSSVWNSISILGITHLSKASTPVLIFLRGLCCELCRILSFIMFILF